MPEEKIYHIGDNKSRASAATPVVNQDVAMSEEHTQTQPLPPNGGDASLPTVGSSNSLLLFLGSVCAFVLVLGHPRPSYPAPGLSIHPLLPFPVIAVPASFHFRPSPAHPTERDQISPNLTMAATGSGVLRGEETMYTHRFDHTDKTTPASSTASGAGEFDAFSKTEVELAKAKRVYHNLEKRLDQERHTFQDKAGALQNRINDLETRLHQAKVNRLAQEEEARVRQTALEAEGKRERTRNALLEDELRETKEAWMQRLADERKGWQQKTAEEVALSQSQMAEAQAQHGEELRETKDAWVHRLGEERKAWQQKVTEKVVLLQGQIDEARVHYTSQIKNLQEDLREALAGRCRVGVLFFGEDGVEGKGKPPQRWHMHVSGFRFTNDVSHISTLIVSLPLPPHCSFTLVFSPSLPPFSQTQEELDVTKTLLREEGMQRRALKMEVEEFKGKYRRCMELAAELINVRNGSGGCSPSKGTTTGQQQQQQGNATSRSPTFASTATGNSPRMTATPVSTTRPVTSSFRLSTENDVLKKQLKLTQVLLDEELRKNHSLRQSLTHLNM